MLTLYERQQTRDALAIGNPRESVDWKCQVQAWEVRAGRDVERQLIADAEREAKQ